MPETLQEGRTPGDWLQFEESSHFSRDAKTVASGQNLKSGTVLGQVTASKEFVACDPTASDGSEVARALNLVDVNATDAAKKAVLITRHAEVNRSGLIFGAGFTTEALRDAAMAELLDQSIKHV